MTHQAAFAPVLSVRLNCFSSRFFSSSLLFLFLFIFIFLLSCVSLKSPAIFGRRFWGDVAALLCVGARSASWPAEESLQVAATGERESCCCCCCSDDDAAIRWTDGRALVVRVARFPATQQSYCFFFFTTQKANPRPPPDWRSFGRGGRSGRVGEGRNLLAFCATLSRLPLAPTGQSFEGSRRPATSRKWRSQSQWSLLARGIKRSVAAARCPLQRCYGNSNNNDNSDSDF